MRYFSYAFHGILAVCLLAVSGLAILSGPQMLRLEMMPWSGATLAWVLLAGAAFALLSLWLAVRGKARILFLLWAAAVPVMLLKGYIFSGYKFSGNFTTAVVLIVLSLAALAGAWFQFLARPQQRIY
jgi:hypothetical protein